ncbi:glycoside hydrolase family 2 TIM barrel-domain containing protein [Paenibacillus eucommiae]|uniref:Beta-glucuronidase n=1 Tax=Paenibacillus eucommiae TaxID=1355755 RepID=A0ABS4IRF8_9BACL|nr:glycoside hydrolase family 2 TIM barrel-domain containing protein [Paenibacillus eucommiae]MBP1990143.1 beta-glucuronidase [Paenibacillus eucommiae]
MTLAEAVPQTMIFNKGTFFTDIDNRGEQQEWFSLDYDKSNWMGVAVPGAWDFYSHAFWGYEGIGWYCLEIEGARVQPGYNQRLQFGRVSGQAKVWINGELAGEHIGGYLPFEYDITSFLHTNGTNQVVVRVDNVPRSNWLPGTTLIEWIQYGGILQPVKLVTSSTCFISSAAIEASPDQGGAKVTCKVALTNTEAASFEGIIRLKIPAGSNIGNAEADNAVHTYTASIDVVCPAGQKAFFTTTIDMSKAQLWTLESPQLYDVMVQLLGRGGEAVDEKQERFGVRTIEVQGTQICLNGEPIIIKGVNRYDEVDGYGQTVPEEVIRADLLKIKQAGVNCIRTHYPMDPLHMDIMDEIGLLLMEEIPLNWWLKPWEIDAEVDEAENNEIIDRAESALQEMIERGRNHPCIIVWSMCNESGTNKPYGINAMRRLMRKARELDSTRLVSFVAVGHTSGHQAFDEADIVFINLYYGSVIEPFAYHIDQLNEFATAPTANHLRDTVAEFQGKPVVVTEFGMQAITGIHGDHRYSEAFQAAYIESVWQAITSVDGVQGGLLWCWADYYHRRTLAGAWSAAYGSYGVVTIDRQDKEALHTLTRLFQDIV